MHMFKPDETMRLRAHHICCSEMSLQVTSDRSAEFAEHVKTVDNALHSETAIIQVAEGVDRVCTYCLHRAGDKCAAPKGGDEGVRKWDAILVRELGVSFGTVMSAPEWRALLATRKPFQMCARCGYRLTCPGAKPKERS